MFFLKQEQRGRSGQEGSICKLFLNKSKTNSDSRVTGYTGKARCRLDAKHTQIARKRNSNWNLENPERPEHLNGLRWPQTARATGYSVFSFSQFSISVTLLTTSLDTEGTRHGPPSAEITSAKHTQHRCRCLSCLFFSFSVFSILSISIFTSNALYKA